MKRIGVLVAICMAILMSADGCDDGEFVPALEIPNMEDNGGLLKG